MTSPTQRTLARCRAIGWTASVAERWVPQAKKRVDLFGFIDVVALVPHGGIVGIQTTTASHAADRCNKILNLESAIAWRRSGGMIHVHGWRKSGKRWLCNEYHIGIDDGELYAVRID